MPSEDFSPNLGLPYLLPNQAQKHVTVNESLRAFDILVMASVEEAGLDIPPVSPGEGGVWIVGSAPSAEWSGYALELAAWQDGAWMFYAPSPGWRVWDRAASALRIYDGTNWAVLETGSGGGPGGLTETQNLEFVGLATTADGANPFAARLNSALWTARETTDNGTGDIRLALNKEASSNTVSLLFQSAYGGRAEFGLVGDDRFSVRVSPDGGSWLDALKIDNATGDLGVGTDPVAGQKLAVGGSIIAETGDGSVSLDTNGRLELSRNGSGATQISSRSGGSHLKFGVTKATNAFKGSVLELDPDAETFKTQFDFIPSPGGSLDIGSASSSFRDLYLVNAPSVSSDRRQKHDIAELAQAGDLLTRLRPVSFRRNGSDRMSFGFLAQDVRAALIETGLEHASLWAMADAADPDSLQSLRQEELIPVLVAVVQDLLTRLDAVSMAGEHKHV
ncbi:MAG: DUF2793 domain-containing protein [Pseudomonadota bacterium]